LFKQDAPIHISNLNGVDSKELLQKQDENGRKVKNSKGLNKKIREVISK